MAEKVELKGAKNGDFNGAMGFRKGSNDNLWKDASEAVLKNRKF